MLIYFICLIFAESGIASGAVSSLAEAWSAAMCWTATPDLICGHKTRIMRSELSFNVFPDPTSDISSIAREITQTLSIPADHPNG